MEEDHHTLGERVRDVEEDTRNKEDDYETKLKKEEELKKEINRKKEDASKLAQNIWQLEKVKEKFGLEAS